jgi:hypothetical protein
VSSKHSSTPMEKMEPIPEQAIPEQAIPEQGNLLKNPG